MAGSRLSGVGAAGKAKKQAASFARRRFNVEASD